MPLWPRRKRAQAGEGELADNNSNVCVLCGLGGSLLCCDACPGAFHLRCLGEFSKSLPAGEWLCAECCLGGRGPPLPAAAAAPHCWPAHSCTEHCHHFQP